MRYKVYGLQQCVANMILEETKCRFESKKEIVLTISEKLLEFVNRKRVAF